MTGERHTVRMDRTLSLIEDIYESGVRPEHWHVLLPLLADALGTTDATMGGVTANHAPLLISARTDPALIQSYAAHYHARNPMQLAVMGQPIGRVIRDTMVMDRTRFRSTEFYNEWCIPQGFLTGSALNMAAAGNWSAMIMFSGRHDLDAEAFKLLQALGPHLVRAFQLNEILHETEARGLGALGALEHIDRGALVVESTGQVRSVNAIADTILGLNDGLLLAQGRLTCTDAQDNTALQRLLGLSQRGGIEASGAALSITRGPGRSPLSLLCVPFHPSRNWPGFGQRKTLIFLTDPDARLERQSQWLREKFGLTPAETALASEIAKSGGRKTAAASRGVSIATARTQLSSIFDKTGVRRQSELLRLLLGSSDKPS